MEITCLGLSKYTADVPVSYEDVRSLVNQFFALKEFRIHVLNKSSGNCKLLQSEADYNKHKEKNMSIFVVPQQDGRHISWDSIATNKSIPAQDSSDEDVEESLVDEEMCWKPVSEGSGSGTKPDFAGSQDVQTQSITRIDQATQTTEVAYDPNLLIATLRSTVKAAVFECLQRSISEFEFLFFCNRCRLRHTAAVLMYCQRCHQFLCQECEELHEATHALFVFKSQIQLQLHQSIIDFRSKEQFQLRKLELMSYEEWRKKFKLLSEHGSRHRN